MSLTLRNRKKIHQALAIMNKTLEEAEKLRFSMERNYKVPPSARTQRIPITNPTNEISEVTKIVRRPVHHYPVRRMVTYGAMACIATFALLNSLISLHRYCTSSKVEYIYVTTDCNSHIQTCPGTP
jgi:hypothetical protein